MLGSGAVTIQRTVQVVVNELFSFSEKLPYLSRFFFKEDSLYHSPTTISPYFVTFCFFMKISKCSLFNFSTLCEVFASNLEFCALPNTLTHPHTETLTLPVLTSVWFICIIYGGIY